MDNLLFAEGQIDTGWAVGLVAVVSALSALAGAAGNKLIEYRKTVNDGQLAIMQEEQKSVRLQLESIRTAAIAAEHKAKEAMDHATRCDEMHRQADIDRAEMRGMLKGSQEDRANLNQQLLVAVKENAELTGRVTVLQAHVARDTSETLQLAEKQGRVEARIAKLENGGHKPPA